MDFYICSINKNKSDKKALCSKFILVHVEPAFNLQDTDSIIVHEHLITCKFGHPRWL